MRLPKRLLSKQTATNGEAAFFAKRYRRAVSLARKRAVLDALMAYGSKTDIIYRSFLYAEFESLLGVKFPLLWGCYKNKRYKVAKKYMPIPAGNFAVLYAPKF